MEEYRVRIQAETFEVYGGACVCCGEHRKSMLTIDHVNGGGNKHRESLGMTAGGYRFYGWLKRQGWPQDGYQLLCYNCNLSKVRNGGVCEHVT